MNPMVEKLSVERRLLVRRHADTAGHEFRQNSEQIVPDNILRWAEQLDVTEEQLARAMKQVGTNVEDVIRHLTNPDVR